MYNYNGVILLNTNKFTLAYSKTSILIFSTLLGLNAIIVALLWLFYIFSNSHFCHGIYFQQLLGTIDTIFDFFYALFPLVVVIIQVGFNIIAGVGALQTSNMYVFYYIIIQPIKLR